MLTDSDTLLRAILSMTARQSFPTEQLAKIVIKGSGDKQLRAFNMCDGTKNQGEIAKAMKLDPASFSRTVARWVESGVVFRLGSGRDTTLLHAYPLPMDAAKKTRSEK